LHVFVVQHIQISEKVGGLKMFAHQISQLRRDILRLAQTTDTTTSRRK
jgi:hypothetical protein